MFLKEFTQPFCPQDFNPRKIIHGVGRGYGLLRNATKWTVPEVGPGAPKTRSARGQQWRLVVAYAGFEIFSKSMLGNFAAQGGRGVIPFLDCLGSFSTEGIAIAAGRKAPRAIKNGDLLDFLRTHKRDQPILEKWLDTATMKQETVEWPLVEAISLARVIRNVTAHGVLSASLAQQLNVHALCCNLVEALAGTATHTLSSNI